MAFKGQLLTNHAENKNYWSERKEARIHVHFLFIFQDRLEHRFTAPICLGHLLHIWGSFTQSTQFNSLYVYCPKFQKKKKSTKLSSRSSDHDNKQLYLRGLWHLEVPLNISLINRYTSGAEAIPATAFVHTQPHFSLSWEKERECGWFFLNTCFPEDNNEQNNK